MALISTEQNVFNINQCSSFSADFCEIEIRLVFVALSIKAGANPKRLPIMPRKPDPPPLFVNIKKLDHRVSGLIRTGLKLDIHLFKLLLELHKGILCRQPLELKFRCPGGQHAT